MAANPPAVYPKGSFRATASVLPRETADSDRKISPGQAAVSKVPILTSLELTKVGGTYQYRLTWGNGTPTEIWTKDGVSVVQHPNGFVYVMRNDVYTLPDLASFTEASIGWIQGATPKGESKYKEKTALLYQREMEFPEELVVRYQAWVDPETRRPIAMDDGVNIYEFTYGSDEPTGPLTMPDFLRKEFDRYRQAMMPPRQL